MEKDSQFRMVMDILTIVCLGVLLVILLMVLLPLVF